MSVRGMRRLVGLYFVAFAFAVTWPGMVPFNRIEPLVLGLPFSMAWVAAWVVVGCLLLVALDAVERRGRRHADDPREGDA